MKFIIKQVEPIICKILPEVDLTPLPDNRHGQFWSEPGRFLAVIQVHLVAS